MAPIVVEVCIPNKEQFACASSLLTRPGFDVRNTGITNASAPVIVSAGNSFGEMNGGVDGIINTHLSHFTRPPQYIQEDVKSTIASEYFGELPVGSCIIIPTTHPKHTSLLYAPTMRVAEDVSGSVNAYLAMRAALVCARRSGMTFIACPLLCTGAGKMSVAKACMQMQAAWDTLFDPRHSLIEGDWQTFHQHHRCLTGAT